MMVPSTTKLSLGWLQTITSFLCDILSNTTPIQEITLPVGPMGKIFVLGQIVVFLFNRVEKHKRACQESPFG